jgi:hypothetical protein
MSLFLISFLYLLGPVFNAIHPIFDVIFLVSGLLTVYYVLVVRRFPPGYMKWFLILFVVYGYMLISISFYPRVSISDYIQVGLRPIRIYITVLGGWILAYLYYIRGHTFRLVITHMYFAIGLHSIIMIAQFQYPAFKDFVYSYTTNIAVSGIDNYYYEYHYRMGGLAGGFGSATLSVSQSVGLLLAPFVLRENTGNHKLVIYLFAVLIAASVLLSGRSGVLSSLLFFPLSMYIIGNRNFVGASIRVIFSILVLGAGIILLINFISVLPAQSELYASISRSIDTFISFQDTGNFSDNTVNTLFTHILFPSDMVVLLLGDGEHLVNTQFERTLQSDIGYIRNIWSFGFIVSVLLWGPTLYFLYVAIKKFYNHTSAKVLFIVTLVILFFHAKEAFLYSRILLSYFSLLLGCLYFEIYHTNYQKRLSHSLASPRYSRHLTAS